MILMIKSRGGNILRYIYIYTRILMFNHDYDVDFRLTVMLRSITDHYG